MIEKVGVYCRLSDEDRDKINKTDDSDSIVNQRSMCLKYATQNGWNVVDIYSDDDFSGAGIYRPDFERLINDCKNGKINLVLCKSQSRFSRDMEVIERYLHNKFIEWGVRFVSIIDNADTSIESNKKSRQINGLINEWYLDDLSQNIRKSLKNKREDGLFMGSFASYGYDRDEDGHKLVVDPVAAEVVKKIFKMYADGYGYHRICEYLNNNNIPPRSVYKRQKGSKFVCHSCDYDKVRWNPDTVAQILRNEVYIGNLVQGKTTYVSYKNHKEKAVPKKDWCRVENTHEAIIDIDTWNKVQEIYKKRSVEYMGENKDIKKYSMKYTFSNMIVCGHCGCSYTRRKFTYRNNDGVEHEHVYWHCSSDVKKSNCPDSITIRDEELKSLFMTLFNTFLNKSRNDKLINEICEQISRDDSQEKLFRINEKIEQCKTKLARLIELNINQEINNEVFTTKNDLLNEELRNLEKEKEKVMDIKEEIRKEEKRLKNIEKELRNTKTMYSFDENIFKTLISKIKIGDYDENGFFQPNVVKFILNIKNHSSDDSINFLSFRLDERYN